MKNTSEIEDDAEKYLSSLCSLMSFLVYANTDSPQYFGGVSSTDALEAMQNVIGYDDEKFKSLKKIFEGDV